MEEIKQLLGTTSLSGAVAFGFWVAYKLYPMYLNRSKGNGSSVTTGAYKDSRIDELMEFKEVMENNHNTDLARLLEKDRQSDETHRQLWEAVNSLRRDIQQQGQDLAFIKGKLNGHLK